jgi:hypothetical protein
MIGNSTFDIIGTFFYYCKTINLHISLLEFLNKTNSDADHLNPLKLILKTVLTHMLKSNEYKTKN